MNNFDVIICGAGAAGLYGAYNLSRDLNVLVIAKRELTLCNSSLAQGGIAGVYRSPADSPEKHKHDTFVAGGFENDFLLPSPELQDTGLPQVVHRQPASTLIILS